MSHLRDDDLVLHYYGEDGTRMVDVERHLQECAQCERAYEALARTLDAVTPPALVEGIPSVSETLAIRQLIRDRQRSRPQTGLAALVWLVPLLYPFSFQALFASARLAREQPAALALVALTAMWTFAGPFVSVFALNHMARDSFERTSTRVLIFGALIATTSPVLFVLGSRLGLGLPAWYGAITVASLLALYRWRATMRSAARLLLVHRLSGFVITVFALAHVGNQATAFVSVSSYTATRDVMRVVYHQPVVYVLILAAVAIQIATGAAIGMKKVRAGATTANLQAVTGWYLAAFLLTHVFSGLVLTQHRVPTAVAAAVSQFDLLASARSTAQLPFLLLGVAAFLFHVGAYARLTALAYLAEASVRRLSYAAMVVGTTVVLTVGLALCGIHIIR